MANNLPPTAEAIQIIQEGDEMVAVIDGEKLTTEQIGALLSTPIISVKIRRRIGRDVLLDTYFRLLKSVVIRDGKASK
jgi:hypothetical protein